MKKAELLKRKPLGKILSRIYDYPLTVIEAPMGFGKTTAVRSFLKAEKNNPLWIAFLNTGESTPPFWNNFTAQLNRLDETVSTKLKALGFPADIPQTEKVVTLLNSVIFPAKTVLVIDDFHLSPDLSINRFLMRIIAEQMDNLHIVIITRDTTHIDFQELLSKGLCYIISQQQLKFSKDEVHAYCRMMTGNMSETEIQKISDYTDGWISLIYMILLASENGVPVGMNDSIDELVEKVLFNTYEESIRSFLLKLSLLDIFTAKQALFVTGEERALEILKKLRKENAFVYYDQSTQTYKIHNVLLDFLRTKRQFKFKEEDLRGLYSRLGEWELSGNNFIAAYGYFNKAGDTERILAHLNNPKNIRNELTSFEGSFEMFRAASYELLYQYPLAYLQHLLLSIVKGDGATIADCTRQLDDLKKAYEDMENIDEDDRNHIIAEILIFKRFTSFNVINSSSEHNAEILRLLNGQQSYIMSRENEFTMGSPHLLYVYFRDQGAFLQISQLAVERFTAYAVFTGGSGTGSEYLIPAEYALETGDWKAAELNSFKAIYKAQTKEQTSIIICAKFSLIRLYLLQGKVSEAIDMLKQLEEDIAPLNNSIYNTTVDLCKGYAYACIGQREKIPFWLQAGNMAAADLLYHGIAFNYIIHGKAVMLSGNYMALEVLTEDLQEQFSLFSNQLGFIHNHIFKAVAKYHLYGLDKGVAELEQALVKAQADDILLPFAENASYIMDMLRIMANKDSRNEYLQKVVSYSEQYLEGLKASQPDKVKLSKRETEVLSLTAEGLKREEVAERLSVSLGTVKTHLANIYQKLEASGKVAAIKIARMDGLI
ncbi:LuxR family maltose regulon positive regulatory protein [Kineothrix alysoides]|uniref:LuxR family maltose regulon positive regulatory protein n=1 Tax=Kineothrix alysoides TaxID=1469948 RepID=A0A4R1R3D2_9FIRM|nr:LuxR C-terminal-related transcriptional regulator [Kineothrix alysoides]TCL59870.1 LuxR family maltose regulon positive regulatory protein [Kineothrix alysoides]